MLLLSRLHAYNGLLGGEGQLCDALKALLEVGLDAQGVLGLRQDLQQLVVRQEEEPLEGKCGQFVNFIVLYACGN